jgi:hypothetical protein
MKMQTRVFPDLDALSRGALAGNTRPPSCKRCGQAVEG